jgi:hypothetical protein
VCTAADGENEEEMDDAILDTHAAWVGLFKVSEPNPPGKMLAFLLITCTICGLSLFLKANALSFSSNHEWMKSILYSYILCEGLFLPCTFPTVNNFSHAVAWHRTLLPGPQWCLYHLQEKIEHFDNWGRPPGAPVETTAHKNKGRITIKVRWQGAALIGCVGSKKTSTQRFLESVLLIGVHWTVCSVMTS